MAEKKEKPIGKVTHYYDKISVAIVKLMLGLKEGDKVKFTGNKTDFEQEIESIEIEHEKVKKAKKGDVVGIKTKEKVRENDLVYLVK